MKEFQISTKQVELQKRKRLIYSIPSILISLIAGIFIGLSKTNYSGNMYVILLPVIILATLAIFIGLRRGNQINNDTLSSYKIELLDNSIKKYQKNACLIEIEKSEIIAITEIVNKAITIKTKNFNKYIEIPVHIEGYSDLKELLSQWMNITKSERSSSQFLRIFPVIGVVLGFLIIILCEYPYIVIPVGIIMILILLWSILTILKNPHIDARIKKSLWILILPIISLLLKVLSFIL